MFEPTYKTSILFACPKIYLPDPVYLGLFYKYRCHTLSDPSFVNIYSKDLNSQTVRVSDLQCWDNGNTRRSKCHKIYTSIISDQEPYPKELHETTNKYKLPVHLQRPN